MTRHDKNAFIEPMLLLAADMLLEGPGWGYGLKLDGFRVVGIKTGGLVPPPLLKRQGANQIMEWACAPWNAAAMGLRRIPAARDKGPRRSGHGGAGHVHPAQGVAQKSDRLDGARVREEFPRGRDEGAGVGRVNRDSLTLVMLAGPPAIHIPGVVSLVVRSEFMPYNTQLFINGVWTDSVDGATLNVVNPATGESIGKVSHAKLPDLDLALEAAENGFHAWRKISAYDRSKIMRKAADQLRANVDSIMRTMTTEQGKPLIEAKGEILLAADLIEWFAEESRRTYGRVIPPRVEGVYQLVVKEPVGPVAAFSPWNFPINQSVRKISAALAAGCSIILKGPEETPASVAALVRAFAEAGVTPGAVNLVFGVPSVISEYLIPHPVIRKISFTGSTAVGKHLAALAGLHMKRVTMELGGHAPAIIFEDADLDAAAKILAANKYRNAGQVCVAPTRFLVQKKVYDSFVEKFIAASKKVKVGDGLDSGTTMGPLAHDRRVTAMEGFVSDAVEKGAQIQTGGERLGEKGFFWEPTVLTNTADNSRVMNEEPFGPVAVMVPFNDFDEAVKEANRLPYGLAAYAYTKSVRTANLIGSAIESGMVSINHHGLALPEVPFGGVKDSGYGSEGGSEAIDAYLNSKFITQAGL